MRKGKDSLGAYAAVVTLAAGTVAAATAPNVVVVGWDGINRVEVDGLLASGELPHLQSIIDDGTRIDIRIDSHAVTYTVPGWMAVHTSIWPEDNNDIQNQAHHQVPVPDGWTLFERIQSFTPDARIAWISGKHLTGMTDQRLFSGMRDNMVRPLETPYYYVGEDDPNEPIIGHALDVVDQHDFEQHPLLMFMHFAHPDQSGHACRQDSTVRADAYAASPDRPRGTLDDCENSCDSVRDEWVEFEYGVDHYTGELIQALEDQGQWDNTYLFVVSDHGFHAIGNRHDSRTPQNWNDVADLLVATNVPGFTMRSPSQIEFADSVLGLLGHPELQHVRVANGAFEFGLDHWTPVLSGDSTVEVVVDGGSAFSWENSLRIEAGIVPDLAYVEQAIEPPMTETEGEFQLVGYLLIDEYGHVPGGQKMVVRGTRRDTGESIEVAGLWFSSGGVILSLPDGRQKTISEPLPVRAWSRAKLQVEFGDTGYNVIAQVKWPGLEEVVESSGQVGIAVDIDSVRLGDDDPELGKESIVAWDDVRAYNLITDQDYWGLDWQHPNSHDGCFPNGRSEGPSGELLFEVVCVVPEDAIDLRGDGDGHSHDGPDGNQQCPE